MTTALRHDALARFGYALSDATRTQILMRLADAPGYPSDLAVEIGVLAEVLQS